MEAIKNNNQGFVVPLAAYILTLIVAGALYIVFILWVGIPFFDSFVPSGSFKEFIHLVVYAFPLLILFGCSLWLIRVSSKHSGGVGGWD